MINANKEEEEEEEEGIIDKRILSVICTTPFNRDSLVQVFLLLPRPSLPPPPPPPPSPPPPPPPRYFIIK
uniref:Uncharacterized protein n=1 Tax=Syphacia muris TaxID=451379 RepID=A0A0N5B0D7_9BILA